MGLFDFLKKKESKQTSGKEKVEEPKVTEKTTDELPVEEKKAEEHPKEEPVAQPDVQTSGQPTEKEVESDAPMSFEELFVKAFDDARLREEFYKRLLDENLLILTSDDLPSDGNPAEKKLRIAQLADKRVPVFTSEARIYDNNVIKEKHPCMAIPGRKLFEITKGAKYILNPFSTLNKELVPEEVDWILKGGQGGASAVKEGTNQPRRVRVGYPADCPQEMIDALNQKLPAFPAVLAVYIGFMEILESNEEPRYVFGVQANGLNQEIAQTIGETAAPFLKGKGNIEIMAVDPEKREGLTNYFLSTNPIYKSQA